MSVRWNEWGKSGLGITRVTLIHLVVRDVSPIPVSKKLPFKTLVNECSSAVVSNARDYLQIKQNLSIDLLHIFWKISSKIL